MFFFFQAEDGIRDKLVTGVQTCALPICPSGLWQTRNQRAAPPPLRGEPGLPGRHGEEGDARDRRDARPPFRGDRGDPGSPLLPLLPIPSGIQIEADAPPPTLQELHQCLQAVPADPALIRELAGRDGWRSPAISPSGAGLRSCSSPVLA